jgi:DNA-binding IclR family transcriptional regulator
MVLLALEHEQPTSVDTIVQQTGLPGESVAQILKGLVAKGLIDESELASPPDKDASERR